MSERPPLGFWASEGLCQTGVSVCACARVKKPERGAWMDLGRALPCLSLHGPPGLGQVLVVAVRWLPALGRALRLCSLKPWEVVYPPQRERRNFGNPGSLTDDSPLPRPGSWRLCLPGLLQGASGQTAPPPGPTCHPGPAPPGPHVAAAPRVPLPVFLGRAMINPSAGIIRASLVTWAHGGT